MDYCCNARAGGQPASTVTGQPSNLRADRDTAQYCANPVAGQGDMMNIDYPFHFDSRGCTAATDSSDHIRDMIEEFLFTSPGERVNRSDFGSGLLGRIFEPNSPEMAAALQFTIQAGLQRWLGDLIEVRQLEVTSEESTLTIAITYAIRGTAEVRHEAFTMESML
jgi:hypothetical protein